MSASQSGVYNTQQFTDMGAPLVGGRLYTYTYGTTAQKTAYTDHAGTIPHTYTADGLGGQYIALNARGELPAPLYLAAGSYDLALKTAAGVTVWTLRADPIYDATASLRADLAASSGASLVGANAYQTQDEVNKERVSVTRYGADPTGVTDSTTAITIAIAYCAPLGKVVYLPSGRYIWNGGAITLDNVAIEGEKMPSLNAAETALESGAIIVGTWNVTGRNPSVRNIGIDHGVVAFPSVAGNALWLSRAGGPVSSINTGGKAVVENVVCLVARPTDAFHGCLVEGYADCFIDKVISVNGFYNFAIKNQRCNISNIIAKYGSNTAVIVKSDPVYGLCESVNISNAVIYGLHGVTGSLIEVLAFGEQIQKINISNVSGRYATGGAIFIAGSAAGTALNDIQISNCTFGDTNYGLLVDGLVSPEIYDINISNTSFVNVGAQAIYLLHYAGATKLDNIYISLGAGNEVPQGAIDVGANTASFSMDNVDIVINYSTTALGGVLLRNPATSNRIGLGKFQISGNIPQNGFSTPSITGASQTLTPLWDGRGNESFIQPVPTGTTTVGTIPNTMPNGTLWPVGYRLTIQNNGAVPMTMLHNPAGFIFNRGTSNFVIQPNETVTYVFGTYVWHMVN